MRLIDGYLPEREIIKIFLGPYKNQFEEVDSYAFSPSSKTTILITTFNKIINGELKIKIHYTRTKNAIRFIVKKLSKDPFSEMWCNQQELLFSIADPKGPKELQVILSSYLSLNSSNPNS